jgi:hypothetical protein
MGVAVDDGDDNDDEEDRGDVDDVAQPVSRMIAVAVRTDTKRRSGS